MELFLQYPMNKMSYKYVSVQNYLSIYLSIYLSYIYHIFIYHLSVYLSIYLSVYLSVCLSVNSIWIQNIKSHAGENMK